MKVDISYNMLGVYFANYLPKVEYTETYEEVEE